MLWLSFGRILIQGVPKIMTVCLFRPKWLNAPLKNILLEFRHLFDCSFVEKSLKSVAFHWCYFVQYSVYSREKTIYFFGTINDVHLSWQKQQVNVLLKVIHQFLFVIFNMKKKKTCKQRYFAVEHYYNECSKHPPPVLKQSANPVWMKFI